VALVLPPAEQLVLLATTPAHTGTDAAIGPVRPVQSRLLLEAVLPAPVPEAPQVVWFATTAAHTGTDTAIGPVTLDA
jgi:hypothetical protein